MKSDVIRWGVLMLGLVLMVPASAGPFSRQLQTDPPRTGRVITEAGEVVNTANLISSDGIYVRELLADGSRPAIDIHSRIHRGELFTVYKNLASIADAATIDIVLTTPATDWPHVSVNVEFDGSADLLIYEAPAFSGGSALSFINHKFYSTSTFDGTAVYAPTVTGVGTLKADIHVAGGTTAALQPPASGVGGGFDREFLLKNSTSYLIRVINQSGGVIRGGVEVDLYSSSLIPD